MSDATVERISKLEREIAHLDGLLDEERRAEGIATAGREKAERERDEARAECPKISKVVGASPTVIYYTQDAVPYMHIEVPAEGRMIDVRIDSVQAVERVPTGALAPGSHMTDENPQWHRQTVLWLTGGARILVGITDLAFHQLIIDVWQNSDEGEE